MSETSPAKLQCRIIYLLFLFGAIFSLIPEAMISMVGTVGVLVGIIMTYMNRKSAKGTPYESHYQWLIRTFWIGGAVLLPIATVLFAVVVTALSDKSALFMMADSQNTVGALDLSSMNELMVHYMKDNAQLFLVSGAVIIGPAIAWWLIRCVKGLKALSRNKPIENPTAFI